MKEESKLKIDECLLHTKSKIFMISTDLYGNYALKIPIYCKDLLSKRDKLSFISRMYDLVQGELTYNQYSIK